eukprot:CAMPEP_0198721654 /NCGR_PEP_ID=MMETSP1471-20131121/64991_1 /TAXON_ID=41880 /ORGANISM="Pycnococcus provasolii, Strain RCC733" /LENGTH=37 /DNA_ID= /DNA_START= /DNA_END= /DNA_ORIENTATION=
MVPDRIIDQGALIEDGRGRVKGLFFAPHLEDEADILL